MTKIIVNDEPRDIPDGQTVADLVERLNLAAQPVAVEVNQQVVPRRQHQDTQLQHGDRIEIVTLVGGG